MIARAVSPEIKITRSMIHENDSRNVESMVNRGEGELLGRDASPSNGLPAVIRSGESGAPPVDLLPADRGAFTTVPPAGVGDAHTGLSDAPDLVGLLKALRRRWWSALIGGLACSSLAATISGVYPLFTMAMARLFIGERLPRLGLLAVVMAVAGTTLISVAR